MTKYCKQCGAQLNESARFCPGCGATVEAEPGQQEYAPPGQPQQQEYAPPGQPQQQEYAPPPQQGYEPPGYPPQQGYAPPPPQPEQPPQAYGYTTPPPPKKKLPVWLIIVIIVVAFLAICVIVALADSDDTAGRGDAGGPDVEATDGPGAGGADGPTAGDDDGPNMDDVDVPPPGEFSESPIVLGEGTDFPLKGMISIPDNATGKVPAVVLVHGSGDFDMDEEIFGNRPFRDMAEYFASRGIAVIRYDKRNFEHWPKMFEVFGGGLTDREEVIEDAILAAEYIKSDPRVDEDRVYIIGHSLGGALAPRIHSEGGDFAGIISLASTPRSRIDLTYDQSMARIELMPEGEEKEEQLAKMEDWAELMKYYVMSMSDDEAKKTKYGSYTVYYTKDAESHLASDYIKEMTVPFLIMHGSADFLVSVEKDFAAWQDMLAGRKNATFKLYEGLNHFFKPAGGYNINEINEEFAIQGPPDEQVLQDIVKWIISLE